jgi:hypothetical protein
MENNSCLHFYREGDLDYSGVQIYELHIDPQFIHGAAQNQLTFDLDEDLLDTVGEFPQELSQSQPSHVHDDKADAHGHDESSEGSVNLDNDSIPSDHNSELEDDEMAYEQVDGQDCCYDYHKVRQAMAGIDTFANSNLETISWVDQKQLFKFFIKGSKRLRKIFKLPLTAYHRWEKHCQTFVLGLFNYYFRPFPNRLTQNYIRSSFRSYYICGQATTSMPTTTTTTTT